MYKHARALETMTIPTADIDCRALFTRFKEKLQHNTHLQSDSYSNPLCKNFVVSSVWPVPLHACCCSHQPEKRSQRAPTAVALSSATKWSVRRTAGHHGRREREGKNETRATIEGDQSQKMPLPRPSITSNKLPTPARNSAQTNFHMIRQALRAKPPTMRPPLSRSTRVIPRPSKENQCLLYTRWRTRQETINRFSRTLAT
jgi:hypothetical protein